MTAYFLPCLSYQPVELLASTYVYIDTDVHMFIELTIDSRFFNTYLWTTIVSG